MKSISKLKQIGAVVLTIAGIIFLNTSPIQAQPHGRLHGKTHHEPHDGEDGEKPMQRMMQKLDLSDAQKQQIKALIAQAREKTRPQRELVISERKKLRELIEAESPDANAIRAQTQKLAGYEAELNIVRAEERKKIEAILTHEQREKWKNIREEWKKKKLENWKRRNHRIKER